MWEFSTISELTLLRRVVRRETVRLVALTLIAIAAFFVTRAVARRAEATAVRDAAAWYDRGRQDLAQGDASAAAMAFRRATMLRRDNKTYALALAGALAQSGNDDAAFRALVALREFNPEDLDVNLALARLAGGRGDTSEAIRYYHHAIYAPSSNPAEARAIRLELIRALLAWNARAAAMSELIAATIDLPADRTAQLELADLLLEAGGAARALELYERVLGEAPGNADALNGAVRASFSLGDYARTARYRVPDSAPEEVRQQVATAQAVLARDPLAPRLSAAERRRRLLQSVASAESRWKACAAQAPATTVAPSGTATQVPAESAVTQARPPAVPEPLELTALKELASPVSVGRDSDRLQAAVLALDRFVRLVEDRCTASTPEDRAVHIIVRMHDVNQP